jgi:hypothetical protein
MGTLKHFGMDWPRSGIVQRGQILAAHDDSGFGRLLFGVGNTTAPSSTLPSPGSPSARRHGDLAHHPARDQVNMRVWHGLSGRYAVVDADVEAVRVQIMQQGAAHPRDQSPHNGLHVWRSNRLGTWRRGITSMWPGATG